MCREWHDFKNLYIQITMTDDGYQVLVDYRSKPSAKTVTVEADTLGEALVLALYEAFSQAGVKPLNR